MCERHFYRCLDCLTVAATSERLREAKCGACSGAIEYMGRVQRDSLVVTGMECPCDFRCTSALGPSCNCKCGGINHGSNVMVAVTRVTGDVPVLQITDSAKAQRIAREWRAAVDAATAELETIAARRVGGWLPMDDYTRWTKLGKVLRAARKLRTHASRMKRMAAVVSVSGQEPATSGQQQLF